MPAVADRILGEIETWIFDLDNTLYPASCRLFDQIHANMTRFIAERLDLSPEAALVRQKAYFREHGTTLRGLMTVDRIDPDDFLAYVHEIDLSCVPPIRFWSRRWRPCPAASLSIPTARCATPSACSRISASQGRSAGSSTLPRRVTSRSRRSPAITSCCDATK